MCPYVSMWFNMVYSISFFQICNSTKRVMQKSIVFHLCSFIVIRISHIVILFIIQLAVLYPISKVDDETEYCPTY